ncbi:c-type cytochrome [Anaplasma bovis]|uniref:c-type cytochrome n=1 Tax=Anaplasma bovis TaxID=186733 RepID=UPI002FF0E855
MGNYNLNRIATGVLLASFIVLIISNVVDLLYVPNYSPEPRGYSVSTDAGPGADGSAGGGGAATLDIAALLANANAERGKSISKKCTACHTINKGGTDRVGPNLGGIIGAPKCRSSSFTYSKALLSKGGKWTEEDLFAFLTSPRNYASGTRMAFPGLSKPEDIADLLAYFKSLE